MVHTERWNFFNTVPHPQESTSDYVNRLVNVAVDCDFENFSIKGAIMQNLLAHSGLPNFRQVILDEKLDMDDTLVWAKEMEQKYGDGIVSVKVELDEEETDFVSNSRNPDNVTSMKQEKCEDVKFNFISNYKDGEEKADSDFKINKKEQKQNKINSHNKNKNAFKAEKESVECDLCTKTFNHAYELRNHKASVHEGVRHQCDLCTKAFTQKGDLRKHKKSVHEGVRYQCDQCDASPFCQLGGLRKHKASVHEGIRYPCDQCDASLTEPFHLIRHKMSVHEGIKYPCDQCGKWFKSTLALKRHKESAHENVRYPCDQCDKVFTLKQKLKQHKASIHEGTRYLCDQCDYEATQMGSLNIHLRNVHGQDPGKLRMDELENGRFPCDQCDFTAKQKQGLQKHKESIHEGIRFMCDQCDYECSQKRILHNHIKRIHDKIEETFICDVCSNTYKSKVSLNIHKKTVHEGFRYECNQCDMKGFLDPSQLTRHKANIHKRKYLCPICGYKSGLRNKFKKHLENRHTTNEITLIQLESIYPDMYDTSQTEENDNRENKRVVDYNYNGNRDDPAKEPLETTPEEGGVVQPSRCGYPHTLNPPAWTQQWTHPLSHTPWQHPLETSKVKTEFTEPQT